jgi:hypothetical protein
MHICFTERDFSEVMRSWKQIVGSGGSGASEAKLYFFKNNFPENALTALKNCDKLLS